MNPNRVRFRAYFSFSVGEVATCHAHAAVTAFIYIAEYKESRPTPALLYVNVT
jgi:hypothetical protein